MTVRPSQTTTTLRPSPLEEARPKRLPLRLPAAAPQLVPARMINEVLYCERLAYLEWSMGEFEDNAYTVEGRSLHQRVDRPGGQLPPPPSSAEGAEASAAAEGGVPYVARSVWLSSQELGITAKIDLVEGTEAGSVVPIEYKRGAVPDVPEGANLPERAQVCAQALLLRSQGYVVPHAEIYFAGSRRRVVIELSEALIDATLHAVHRLRRLAEAGELPPPLLEDPRCDGCSLVGICLPDETNLLRRLDGESLEEPEPLDTPEREDNFGRLDPDPWGLAVGAPSLAELRRLHPARDERLPLYVLARGGRVGLDGEELVVHTEGKRSSVRLSNTSQVCLFGNVQLTTPALRALAERGIPVAYFSRGGWYYARVLGHEPKNVELRLAQYACAVDPQRCLELARTWTASKIRNGRTLLRRNAQAVGPVVLSELEQLAKKAEAAASLDALLGIEGSAARVYFQSFTGMLRGKAALGAFDWEGRSRRPPKDPINALLSFAYSLLSKDVSIALALAGLDPMLGFFHQPRFGRPALALDVMEEFRPLVADSVVLSVLNNGVVDERSFVVRAGAASLTAAGRKDFLLAWERRLDQLVTHPVFGYRISYRRVLEVQARLLGRWLLGELEALPPFRTR